MNYIDLLNIGQKKLRKKKISTSFIDSEILLSYVLKISRERLLCNLDKKLSKNQIRLFKKLIKLIVEKILKKIKKNERKSILDIGTGSGCILISILLERRKCKGTGVDISKSAINVAKNNAKIQQVENRVRFINSDIDKFYSNKYDFIVSNPPYIKKLELNDLSEDVKKFEPTEALNGGINGIEIYKKVIMKGSKLLKTGGNLILEIEQKHIFKLSNMLINKKFFINEIFQDLRGYKRCLIATKL